MYLKLMAANWDGLTFVVRDNQKDYDYLEKDGIDIFIYGYPFDGSTNSWISANDVYRLYSRGRLDFVKDIEGVYSIVILDKKEGKCFVIVDRYGIYSLFYLKNDKHVILSDSISEIIPFIPHLKLNQESIIEYLTFGFKLGNKTHIRGIYEFESATIYKINNELEIAGNIYWNFLGKPKRDTMTREDFVKTFNVHIMTAMGLEKKVSLPLTGGLDTRLIFSVCYPEKEKLHSFTYGEQNTPDVKIAQKISDHFGIKHSFYELNEEWIRKIPSMLEKEAEIFNGLIPVVLFLHDVELCKREVNKGELLVWGILGNQVWRCMLGSKEINSMNMDDLSHEILKIYHITKANLTDIYNDYSDKEVINLLKKSVKNELSKAKNAKVPINLLEFFVFKNYSSNWASNILKLTGKYFKIFSAYLHKDLLQEIPHMKLEEKIDGNIQKYIIIKNNYYLSNVPLDSGKTIDTNLSLKIKSKKSLLSRYFRKAVNRISQKIFKIDIFRFPLRFNYPNWLRKYHKEFILDILSYEQMFTKKFFKKQELEKTVSLYLNGDKSVAQFISCLVSLELWLKKISKEKEVIEKRDE